jgi:hypothetical protein
MDYDELKKKYGESLEEKGWRPSKLVVALLLIVAVCAVAVYSIYFFPSKSMTTEAILSEIDSFSPDEITVNVISEGKCKSLEKTDGYWLVGDCEDDVEFKLFLYGDKYQLGYCASWQTHREAFNGLKKFFGSPACIDETLEDRKVEEPPWTGKDYDVYSVCGLKVMFRDKCIISVIG